MIRGLFNLFAALSLMLFSLTLGFRVAEFFVEIPQLQIQGSSYWGVLGFGKLAFLHCSKEVANHLSCADIGFSFLGYRYIHPKYMTLIMLPYGLTLCLTSFLPLYWLVARIRNRSARLAMQGRCTQCGYDLRATPDRCPECGLVPWRLNSQE